MATPINTTVLASAVGLSESQLTVGAPEGLRLVIEISVRLRGGGGVGGLSAETMVALSANVTGSLGLADGAVRAFETIPRAAPPAAANESWVPSVVGFSIVFSIVGASVALCVAMATPRLVHRARARRIEQQDRRVAVNIDSGRCTTTV